MNGDLEEHIEASGSDNDSFHCEVLNYSVRNAFERLIARARIKGLPLHKYKITMNLSVNQKGEANK